jgi:hypothetical protein
MRPSKFLAMFLVLLLTAGVFAQETQQQPPAGNQQQPAATTQQQGSGLPEGLSEQAKNDIKKLLNEAIVTGQEHPFRIVCSAKATPTCTPNAVFISAAAISSIEIEDLPKNKNSLTVTVTANENDENGQEIRAVRRFDKPWIPDRIIIGVNKARRFNPTFATEGVTEKPAFTSSQATNGNQTNANTRGEKSEVEKSEIERYMDNQSTPGLTDEPSPPRQRGSTGATSTSERNSSGGAQAPPQSPGIGFISRGTAEWIYITVQADDDAPQTIAAGLSYQRWFVDMGGFITFGFVSDEELVTEDATPAGSVRVVKKRHKDKIVPGTGIVLNFHPANYPSIAAQFGIATRVDRAASYYLGFGYRLRQLGPNTLATFAAGISATQVKRFPDVSVGDIRSATSVAITQGSNRYAFGPYLSLSLGFSFGGVDKPTTPPNGGNGTN